MAEIMKGKMVEEPGKGLCYVPGEIWTTCSFNYLFYLYVL